MDLAFRPHVIEIPNYFKVWTICFFIFRVNRLSTFKIKCYTIHCWKSASFVFHSTFWQPCAEINKNSMISLSNMYLDYLFWWFQIDLSAAKECELSIYTAKKTTFNWMGSVSFEGLIILMYMVWYSLQLLQTWQVQISTVWLLLR